MFQYAAGRALALSTNQPLLLDLRDFSNYALHSGFELQRVFQIVAKEATNSVVREMLGWKSSALARRLLKRRPFSWLRGKEFVAEPHFQYWPGIVDLRRDCYLYGYWQSERYFFSVSDSIRSEFTFQAPLTGNNKQLSDEIADCQAVSLHVRRGDYVNDRKTSQLMYACSEAYYQAAIDYIAGQVDQPVYFVFSDDIAWCQRNLRLSSPHFWVSHNSGAESYRDMQLMSLCRHHIIANSSFSWWGAWLNSRSDKIVVAPRRWFAKPINTSDLVPREWKLF